MTKMVSNILNIYSRGFLKVCEPRTVTPTNLRGVTVCFNLMLSIILREWVFVFSKIDALLDLSSWTSTLQSNPRSLFHQKQFGSSAPWRLKPNVFVSKLLQRVKNGNEVKVKISGKGITLKWKNKQALFFFTCLVLLAVLVWLLKVALYSLI